MILGIIIIVVLILCIIANIIVIVRLYKDYCKPLYALWNAIKDIDFDSNTIDLTKLDLLEPSGAELSRSIIKKFKSLSDIICVRIDNLNKVVSISEHDKLTGCYNRLRLEKFKHNYTTHDRFNIIFIDVNNLKKMNDINGHEAGDILLRKSAEKLSFWKKYGDVYRLGGDEFLVVVVDKTQQELKKLIDTWYPTVGILNRSTDEFKCVLSYGVSIGRSGDDFDDLMSKADDNMYNMKKAIKRKFNEADR